MKTTYNVNTVVTQEPIQIIGEEPKYEYSVKALAINWDVIVEFFSLGLESIKPKIDKVFFEYSVDIDDLPADSHSITLEPHPKIFGSLKDQSGNTWATDLDFSEFNGQMVIHTVEINLIDRAIRIEFYPNKTD